MTTVDIKTDLHQFIDDLDEHFLRAVHAMVTTYLAKDEVIGYKMTGEPITQRDLEQQIEQSEQQIKEGKYLSTEELRKKMNL
ncbi:MAG: hypothetical protein AAGG68_11485 [Bacteroidota bacterium]